MSGQQNGSRPADGQTTGGRVAARLEALGIALPPVTAPLASYVPAVRTGEWVWVSGQLPMANGALIEAGKVGEGPGLVSPEQAAALARTCAINALAAVAAVAADDPAADPEAALDRIERVVKLTGFVASAPGFTGQPTVINGASQVLGDILGEAGVHARSAVGVAELPLGAPVELDLVVRLAV